MDYVKMFAQAEYEYIQCDMDDIYAFPYFSVPEGYWYITDADPMPRRAEKDLSIYLCGRGQFLKQIHPEKDPTRGICHYWV